MVEGWFKDTIRSDTLKNTTDQRYEYRIDLVNLFQKNSYATLYLKNTASGEEKNIPIDIQTKKITGIGIKEINNWGTLEPTDIFSLYILSTTEELRVPEEKFEIDIKKGTSSRLK